MITTVRSDLAWDGKIAETLSKTSEKKIKQTLKDMTGAMDVNIIEVRRRKDEEDE